MSNADEYARALVRNGYDRLAHRYWEWSRDNDPKYREVWLDDALRHLEPGSLVVELGSGSGLPVAQIVTEAHRIVCVDFSLGQLELVARNAPSADRLVGDMSTVAFRPGSVDAVIAFYSIIHVPREAHAALFASISSWLRPGGVFVASLGGPTDNAGSTDEWIDGVEMYWSFFDAGTTLTMIGAAGLTVERNEVLANFEDGREVRFLWVLARKP